MSKAKLSDALEKLQESGLKVTDSTREGSGIGLIGGVRVPESKSGEDGDDPDNEVPGN